MFVLDRLHSIQEPSPVFLPLSFWSFNINRIQRREQSNSRFCSAVTTRPRSPVLRNLRAAKSRSEEELVQEMWETVGPSCISDREALLTGDFCDSVGHVYFPHNSKHCCIRETGRYCHLIPRIDEHHRVTAISRCLKAGSDPRIAQNE